MSRRLLFLCGSLTPGRDGVGDYTRRLAGALRERGVVVDLASVYDKGTAVEVDTPALLRIPYGSGRDRRQELLRARIAAFAPDWISLQYVPYSFNNKGVPVRFAGEMRPLRNLARWHLMFHEISIDHGGWSTPKTAAISAVQRWCIRRLHRAVRPRVVHTHLPDYGRTLTRIGVENRPLPLFPNIGRPATEEIAPATAQNATTNSAFHLAFFSQMDVPPPVATYLRNLREWLTASSRDLRVSLLGGSDEKVNRVAAELRRQLPGLDVDPVGFLSPEELSRQLLRQDLGITPVLRHAVGKSGTVAAFLTHGVPVAAPCRTKKTPSFFVDGLDELVLDTFSAACLQRATAAIGTADLHPITVAGVADRLLADLSEN